jgi:hypothetical protein
MAGKRRRHNKKKGQNTHSSRVHCRNSKKSNLKTRSRYLKKTIKKNKQKS